MKKENSKSKKKTKILAVGDIHGDTGLVKKLAEKAKKENVDVVILAGDLTFFDNSTKNIIGPFLKNKRDVLLIPGNHEPMTTINFLTEFYSGARNLHGYSFRKGDLGIFGAGYATTAGPFFIPEKELSRKLSKAHEKIKNLKKKIMVTHMHHKGSKAEFSGWEGSSAVKKAIKKFHPDFLITSHIHEAGGIEEKIGKTKVINVSRKAKVFEI